MSNEISRGLQVKSIQICSYWTHQKGGRCASVIGPLIRFLNYIFVADTKVWHHSNNCSVWKSKYHQSGYWIASLGLQNFMFLRPASLFNLVNKTNFVHNFSLVCLYLSISTCWLEVTIRKVLRQATSTQVFLGFPGSISECWDGSHDSK